MYDKKGIGIGMNQPCNTFNVRLTFKNCKQRLWFTSYSVITINFSSQKVMTVITLSERPKCINLYRHFKLIQMNFSNKQRICVCLKTLKYFCVSFLNKK